MRDCSTAICARGKSELNKVGSVSKVELICEGEPSVVVIFVWLLGWLVEF